MGEKPNVKFGDILKFSEEWFRASHEGDFARDIRFVATGRIKEEVEGEYLIAVVKKGTAYVQTYHYTFLEKA
jgi:hypothetical protein